MHENTLYPEIYTKHIGRPMYKFSKRHLGKSKFLAINMAFLPSSAVAGGIGFAITGSPIWAGAIFSFHQFYAPIVTSALRNVHVSERKSLDSFTEE